MSCIFAMIKDIFRAHGLDVTFMAKPIEGVSETEPYTWRSRRKDEESESLCSQNMRKISYLSLRALMESLKTRGYEPFISPQTMAQLVEGKA